MAATDFEKPVSSARAPEPRSRTLPPPKPPEPAKPKRLLKPYRPSAVKQWRFFKAYSVTSLVIGSYLWLNFKRRLFGMAWYDRAVVAVHKRNAKRIENALLELQGLFIKVGQLLSIMANFLPEEFREELEGMQDAVPPRPFEEIEARILKELGKRPDELFARFERTPIAAASLGQVHEATLADGTRCAVKVQHKDIEEVVKLDLVLIRKIMGIVQWFVPVQGLDNYYREIRELLLEELDFEGEAANIRRIRENFANDGSVETPQVVAELSTSRVLTLTFVEGVKVSALDEIDKLGIDRKKLAEKIVHAFCQMIFVDGVYHCDPHPGNLLVQKMPSGEPKLVLIDFGAVGELSQPMREGIPEFLEGVLRRDTDRLIKAMHKMGFLSYGSDEAIVEKVIEHFHRKFQDEVKIESFNLKDIKLDPQRSFDNLIDLRNMNVGLKELSSSIHIPRDWVLLERTLLLLTGVCTNLDPNLNPMQLIRPYLEQFVLGNRDWTQIAIEAVRDTALKAIALPEKLDRYVQKAIRGELEIRVRGLRDGVETMYAIGRQAMYLAVATVLGITAIYAHAQWHDDRLARMLGYSAILPAVLFLVFSIVDRPSRRR
jgi:predicted unusual protein kinase regulating ubiquinone biosynthesis (AarF/ABC1/UbiB family)